MNSNEHDSGSFPFRLAIYLPALTGSKQFSSNEALEAVETFLCDHLGGATSYPATGLYKRASGTVDREPIHVVEAYCETSAWDDVKERVFDLAAETAFALQQESIACSVQGRLHLVEPQRPGGHGKRDDS